MAPVAKAVKDFSAVPKSREPSFLLYKWGERLGLGSVHRHELPSPISLLAISGRNPATSVPSIAMLEGSCVSRPPVVGQDGGIYLHMRSQSRAEKGRFFLCDLCSSRLYELTFLSILGFITYI